jgi:hypothetical protein
LRREYHGTSCRRVNALVKGLPPEAAVWRQNAFTPTEELLVQLLERHDEWARSHLQALLHHKKVSVPAPFHMLRPGEEEQEPANRVETDPAKIAAWFQQNLGGEEVT